MAAAVASVVAAIVTALGLWFINRRNTSGNINRSSAGDLWKAQDDLRHSLEGALEKSLERETRLQDRVAKLEEKNEQLRDQIHVLEDKDDASRERIAVLESEVRKLRELGAP